MTDVFLRVGGVPLYVIPEAWEEEQIEIGDVATGDELALSGKPIETRAGITRRWHGSTPRDLLKKSGFTTGVGWETWMRWLRGQGQCFPLTGGNLLSGAGITFTNIANIAGSSSGGAYGTGKGTVSSGTSVGFKHSNSMGVRRGFSPTGTLGWTFGFWRKGVTDDTAPLSGAGFTEWIAATGATTFAQGSGNPAGVTQYIGGVATANVRVGNMCALSASNFTIYGKSNADTSRAVEYTDVFFVPFIMPATWLTAIFEKLVAASTPRPFPVLPRQKLTGEWLTNEDGPIEVIGRTPHLQQRVGQPATQTWQSTLRELALTFTEW